jgi:hypothetical protein
MSKKPLQVIAGTPDRPLVINDIEIPCYVLEDETRVLSQSGVLESLGRSRGSGMVATSIGADEVPPFIASNNLKPFINNELTALSTPVEFQPLRGGRTAYGYRAQLLPQICSVYLEARAAKSLLRSQTHIAERAEILLRGLATVGIIALVDEATGYQRIREERALATILEQFIAEHLQPWTKTFPYEFYELIFKLKKWPGPDGVKRPSVIGKYTNDIVYERIAPGVLDELKRKNPTLPSGRRQHKHHQWFTPDLGHPNLQKHLEGVMALMRASSNWDSFQRSINRAYPKPGQQMQMYLDDE